MARSTAFSSASLVPKQFGSSSRTRTFPLWLTTGTPLSLGRGGRLVPYQRDSAVKLSRTRLRKACVAYRVKQGGCADLGRWTG